MLKEALVSTRLGALAVDLRERLSLYRGAGSQLENLGEAANNLIARRLLERLCARGGIFVDVGAHIGSVTNGVRRYSAPSAIIAVEAIPEKAEKLRSRFPDITVHACALGDNDGSISFFVDEQRPGFSSLNPGLVEQSRTREINVPLRRLDTLIPAPALVDLIKIDVEGAELGVLLGADAVTSAARPTYMFESGAEPMPGYPRHHLWKWLQDRDYCVLLPNRVAHLDDGLNAEQFEESHFYPRRTTNYFAVANERRAELRNRARQILRLG